MGLWALTHFLVYILLFQGRIRLKGYVHAHKTLSRTKIVIVTKDASNGTTVQENDRSKYTLEYDISQLTYKFKTGSLCTKLKYDQTSVWTHDSTKDGSNYPVEISVNFLTNNFRIKTNNKLYIYAYRSSQWDLTFESEIKLLPPISSLAPKEAYESQNGILDIYYFKPNEIATLARKLSELGIQIITVNDYFKFQTNDLSNFRVYQDNDTTVCEVINFSRFCEVKYKDELIWQDEDSQRVPNYLSSAVFYFKSGTVKLDFTPKPFNTVLSHRFHIYLNFYMKHVCQDYTSPLERVKGKELTLKVLRSTTSNNDSAVNQSSSDSSDSQNDSNSNGSQDASSNEPLNNAQSTDSPPESSVKISETEEAIVLAQDKPGVKRHRFSESDLLIRVIADGESIWTHDPKRDGENYPLEISLHVWERQYFLIKTLHRIYWYTYLNDKWVMNVLYISENALGSELALTIERKMGDKSEPTNETPNNESLSVIESSIYP